MLKAFLGEGNVVGRGVCAAPGVGKAFAVADHQNFAHFVKWQLALSAKMAINQGWHSGLDDGVERLGLGFGVERNSEGVLL